MCKQNWIISYIYLTVLIVIKLWVKQLLVVSIIDNFFKLFFFNFQQFFDFSSSPKIKTNLIYHKRNIQSKVELFESKDQRISKNCKEQYSSTNCYYKTWCKTIKLDKTFGQKIKIKQNWNKPQNYDHIFCIAFHNYYQNCISQGILSTRLCSYLILRFSCIS